MKKLIALILSGTLAASAHAHWQRIDTDSIYGETREVGMKRATRIQDAVVFWERIKRGKTTVLIRRFADCMTHETVTLHLSSGDQSQRVPSPKFTPHEDSAVHATINAACFSTGWNPLPLNDLTEI